MTHNYLFLPLLMPNSIRSFHPSYVIPSLRLYTPFPTTNNSLHSWMTFMDQHTFEVDSPPMLIPRYHVKAFVTITTLRQGSRYNFQYIYIYIIAISVPPLVTEKEQRRSNYYNTMEVSKSIGPEPQGGSPYLSEEDLYSLLDHP